MADKPVLPSTISRNILDTNDPPIEYSSSPIREFISRGEVRRAFLNAKIAPLKAELDKLLEERDSLDVEIRKHEGAVSALRRMPTEILSLIFTFAVPPYAVPNTGKFVSSYYFMNMEEGPWVLSAVCSRWRTISLSQASLWTHILLDFTDDPPDSPSVKGIVPMVEAYLKRSQEQPLDIIFSPFYETHCTETEQIVLDLLAAHSDRWEKATLSGSPELYLALRPLVRDNLPILRILHVNVDSDDDELEISELFDSCPALQEAFVNSGRYGGNRAVTVDLPLEQLLRYSASNHWINHLRVLRCASNLVDCVLRLTGDQLVPEGDPIVLSQLRRLSTSTARVLSRLETPVLRELYCCDHSDGLHQYLKQLPELQTLFVGETTVAADIGLLLLAAPKITNLFLNLPRAFASDLFSLLENHTASSNETAVVPALHTVSLCLGPHQGSLGGPLDENQLMRAVESRWQAGRLRSLHLYSPKFTPSATTLERVEALRSQGMQIELAKRSDRLYSQMVPPDFQLYNDYYHLYEDIFSE
ncbi:hypothetical protein B0H12DRAFT_1120499 [Mycena haematopus]|nr:hypothetical protein B0H12DRAFT_1120499 [Mycena haematopus]